MYEASIIICIIAMVAVCIAVPSILVYLVVDSIRDHRSTKVNPAKGKAHLIFAHCKDCHSLLHMDGTCHWCPSKFRRMEPEFMMDLAIQGAEPTEDEIDFLTQGCCVVCGAFIDSDNVCGCSFKGIILKGDFTILTDDEMDDRFGGWDMDDFVAVGDDEEDAYQAQFAATDYYGRMMATFSDGEDDLDVYDAKPDLTRKEIRISKRATSSLKHKNLTPKPKSKA